MKANDKKIEEKLETLKILSITEEYEGNLKAINQVLYNILLDMIHVVRDASTLNLALSDLELENIIKCIKMFVYIYEFQYNKLSEYTITCKIKYVL